MSVYDPADYEDDDVDDDAVLAELASLREEVRALSAVMAGKNDTPAPSPAPRAGSTKPSGKDWPAVDDDAAWTMRVHEARNEDEVLEILQAREDLAVPPPPSQEETDATREAFLAALDGAKDQDEATKIAHQFGYGVD